MPPLTMKPLPFISLAPGWLPPLPPGPLSIFAQGLTLTQCFWDGPCSAVHRKLTGMEIGIFSGHWPQVLTPVSAGVLRATVIKGLRGSS
jgi:hypothetical protein